MKAIESVFSIIMPDTYMRSNEQIAVLSMLQTCLNLNVVNVQHIPTVRNGDLIVIENGQFLWSISRDGCSEGSLNELKKKILSTG